MKQAIITSAASNATSVAIGVVAGFALLFGVLEPQITHGQLSDTSEFTIQQTITAESSFLVEPADIVMAGSINGVTGGQATGTTQFVVQTNNASGYYVEIDFENNGTPQAMIGDIDASEAIVDYVAGAAAPTFGYTANPAAQLAYAVQSSTTVDTAVAFRNNGAACGTGGFDGASCWKAPDTAAYEIVRRTSPATTGATSSVIFNVTVPSGATPVPSAQTYTATATLSLYNL